MSKAGTRMEFTDQQRDALTELINIGFGRAASALSILVEKRVMIETPSIDLYPILELGKVLHTLPKNDIISVHQVFTGKISGTAMLLMDTVSSNALVNLLNEGEGETGSRQPPEVDQATMQEIGNILLNAFTGSFGNLLQVHISFAVPYVRYETLDNMLHSVVINHKELEFALVVRINFLVLQGNVSGYVAIILGIQSLESLLESMRVFGYID